jgi:hypothetical protein
MMVSSYEYLHPHMPIEKQLGDQFDQPEKGAVRCIEMGRIRPRRGSSSSFRDIGRLTRIQRVASLRARAEPRVEDF